ncbi:GNAT family N-acetyltransferase [Microbacterium sp. AK031]|uniref:GNAT family N-acetyltransferase n=1 Tax=Microbacterium sp. AK031 TaxID=2723076 RepID=UPI002168AA2B|nr:GNAT family N-acetyltransferase [Microbacterium sp. AK031]MCS3842408.1 GNAT superfamily N-acetyltransferase [Microbacterium sp. AK031]
MSEIIITDLVVPERLDAPEAAEFHAMVAIGNRQAELDAGIDDLVETAEEQLPSWRDQTDRSHRGFIARRDGEIVGAAYLSTANDTQATSAEMGVIVIPPHWGSGVEQALLDRVERTARELGRASVLTWTLHPATSDERMLTPTTGWGRVAATALSDLLSANGYVLEQVERNSILPLNGPLTLAEEKLKAATAFAGDDYRIVSWTLPTPEPLRAGYADVISRMATDVPSGDLDIDEEAWDADRVVRHDQNLAAGGQLLSVAAVEHVPTGRLVAFNELVIGADRAGVTHQFGTLVVKEHRGKRLGTIVKCANLLRWRDIAPDSPKISTFNAEENRPMLDINEAIGFVPASYAGAWQKKLD